VFVVRCLDLWLFLLVLCVWGGVWCVGLGLAFLILLVLFVWVGWMVIIGAVSPVCEATDSVCDLS